MFRLLCLDPLSGPFNRIHQVAAETMGGDGDQTLPLGLTTAHKGASARVTACRVV